MLSFSSSNPLQQCQVTLAAGLICRLCRADRHQHLLATSGALDALATRLAGFAVAGGYVVPGADAVAQNDGLFEAFPEPAPRGAKLGPILEAVATILGDSKYRAYRLIGAPSILAIFPSIKFEPTKKHADSEQEVDLNAPASLHESALTAMEYILPSVHTNMPSNLRSRVVSSQMNYSETRTMSRTSLSKFAASAPWESPRLQSASTEIDSDPDDLETPFIPWLVVLARSSDEMERLMAASILASLIKAGAGGKGSREKSIGLLVVPLLLEMISNNTKAVDSEEYPPTATQRTVLLLSVIVTSNKTQARI